MVKVTGLGKGLGSLIPKKVPSDVIADENRDFLVSDSSDKILQLPVDNIEPNPMQPRTTFGHEDLEALIESIKIHGIIQPIIVTKASDGYQLIAGERRLRSAKIIGLQTVPAIVRQAGEQEKLELAIIENVQRTNLNPMEKAVAYQRLMDEFSMSQEEVAEKLGVSRSAVANTLRFLDLPDKVQQALAEHSITEGHAKIIAGLNSEIEQEKFLDKILQYNYTVRDAEKERQKVGSKTKKITQKHHDPLMQEKEDMLRSFLNTKVSIKKQGGQGQLVIEFYSDEELDSIIDHIVD